MDSVDCYIVANGTVGDSNSPSFERITGWTHLYREHPLSEVGEGGKGGLGEVDMLRAGGTASAGVDDAHEDALLGRVADCVTGE